MEGAKTETVEESVKSEVSSTNSNGVVKTTKGDEPLTDFVVIDELNSQAKKETTAVDVNKKENADGKVHTNESVDAQKEQPVKEAIPDSAKNGETTGDTLLLTADEDLEPVLASPKTAKPAATSESVETNADTTKVTLSDSNAEAGDSFKVPEKPSAPKNPRVVWVSNISKTIKATDLKQYLSKAGKVNTAKIVTDGKRCFGYVQMENANDANECIKTLNDTTFDGKKIALSFDKPTKGNASKGTDIKKSTKSSTSAHSRSSDSKRGEKRHRSSPSKSAEQSKDGSDAEPKPAGSTDADSAKPAEKKARSRSRSRDRYIRERNERDRLKRRLVEEERRSREARARHQEVDERQREKEFRLDQERRKLDMERELFEKQKREWARINDERRKLERARLEVEQQRARLEDDLKKERQKRKSPEMLQSVVSKISDPLKKGMKMMKRDDYKSSYESAPPPPKLGMDFNHGLRKPHDSKLSRIGGRKMDVIDRKFYGDPSDRKKHYNRKPEFEENKSYTMKRFANDRQDEHRTQWSPPVYASGLGTSTPRYQDASMPSQSFGGAPPSRTSGYYFQSSSSAPDFRYDQNPNRKY